MFYLAVVCTSNRCQCSWEIMCEMRFSTQVQFLIQNLFESVPFSRIGTYTLDVTITTIMLPAPTRALHPVQGDVGMQLVLCGSFALSS